MKGRVILLALVGALALSGCTLVAPNAAPVRIAPKDVQFGLLNKTIPDTNGVRVRFVTQTVYIVDASGQLAPSSRIVPKPPALATVIEQLLLGPTRIEKLVGYSSALPKSLVVVSAEVHGVTAYLNFATPLSHLPRKQQLLAVGQLVLTANVVGATRGTPIRGVEIRVAGVTQSLLLPNGKHATLATPEDFQSLLNG
ncbi:MAG: GerMN domain-containing protein [Acidimicrobiales bacterium]